MKKAIFCDWAGVDDSYNKITLFDIKDLKDYDLLFFDPLYFAIKYHLRKNPQNIYDKEYINFSEENIVKFLNQVKVASEVISNFINSGGTFVIRSNFPNSEIVIRKESNSGSGEYTKSVISPFFWMERYLGKFAFKKNAADEMVYCDKKNPLYDTFKNCYVNAPLCQETISAGKNEVIAHSGKLTMNPIISRVRFTDSKGQIFFIPQFIIENECDHLIEAFVAFADYKDAKPLLPAWASKFEKELDVVDPYEVVVYEINKKIQKLEDEKSALLQKQSELNDFKELLLATGPELVRIVNKAFRFLGFYMIDPPPALKKGNFDIYLKDKLSPFIVGQIITSKQSTLSIKDINAFTEKIDNCHLSSEPKGLIVANTAYLEDPDKRPIPFTSEFLDANKERNYLLISMPELFEIIRYLISKENSTIKDKIKESIRSEMLECSTFFEINRKKYYTKV